MMPVISAVFVVIGLARVIKGEGPHRCGRRRACREAGPETSACQTASWPRPLYSGFATLASRQRHSKREASCKSMTMFCFSV